MARRARKSQTSLEKQDRPAGSIGALRGLIPYLSPYKAAMAGALVALTAAATTVLFMGVGIRTLVDQGFRSGNPELLDNALVGLFVIIAVLTAATYARFFLVSWIGERVVADLRRDVFNHVLVLDSGFFEKTRVGEVLSRLSTDTTLLQSVVGSQVSVALRNLLLFLGGTAMLFITSPRMTGLVFLVVPLVISPIILFGRKVRRLSRASQDRVADVGALVEETLNAVGIVQAFCHEKIDQDRFDKRISDTLATAIKRIKARASLTAVVMILVFGSIGVILWLGGYDVISGRITAGDLSAFVFYAVVVAGSVGAISEVYGDLQRAAGACERLMELLATVPEMQSPKKPMFLPNPIAGLVNIENVTFSYPSRPKTPSLENFSINVNPGEMVALVGPSGAGKSTVFQLLLRFFDPTQGKITLDGIDISTVNLQALRSQIAFVPQDAIIFATDAWENIRYGRPTATHNEIRLAATAAAAAEFIDPLPEGFNTFLGEKGVRLSGGQRQRIAIARVILRNSPLLLLDEATSALDAESERSVQQALEKAMANRSTIVIAHRLATVLKADRIFVMDKGRIVDSGTHAELIKKDGLYARLAALQFDSN